jgi:cellulose synthase/poly-beta-1,6-N-acetylglucosamine synthase-like glycosyltransferase
LLKIKRGIRNIKKENASFDSVINSTVSIVVAFRNEAANLGNLIHDLSSLDVDGVVVDVLFVNDHSEDDWGKFRQMIDLQPNWRVIDLGSDLSGKKAAISVGIKQAEGDIILITDADCRVPKPWLKGMISRFDENTGFVAGAVKYQNNDSIFASIQSLEFGGLILAGAGLIGVGEPIICSAASMAFKRKLFNEVEGYSSNKALSSGDDEFLMRSISRLGYRVRYLLDGEAIVTTNPSKKLSGFVEQRSRWASKGLFYEDLILILKLVLIFIFYLSFIFSPAIVWFLGCNGVYFLLLSLLLKGITEYFVLIEGKGLFYKNVNLFVFIVAELLHIPYIVFATLSGALGGFVWKGRKLSR